MGWTGEAAAASLTMDLAALASYSIALENLTYQTSCFCPATLAAGLKGSSRRVVADMARRGVKLVGHGALVALAAAGRMCLETKVAIFRMASRKGILERVIDKLTPTAATIACFNNNLRGMPSSSG